MFHDLDFSGSGEVDTPKIPREHRAVISHFAASALLLGKDDSKATTYAQLGAGKLAEMKDQYLAMSHGGRVYVRSRHSVALGCT